MLPTRWVDERISKGLGLNGVDTTKSLCQPTAGRSPKTSKTLLSSKEREYLAKRLEKYVEAHGPLLGKTASA